ncbi:hypothetical protein [Natronosalvus rutilus]|uniref:Uncharacterized protein n=1 Tax=Natronosalvus rutilus TaxID=2953753 RepID=A0A9E7SX89_9EURY|nr:hypothetical protein [Natronosalvus rutilus]UTF54791.1 hypothetical protein NGM29_05855 [Natronosalvus rutilus]
MRPDLQNRRRELWKRVVILGEDEQDVITDLAETYDVAEDTIAEDLSTMETWLSDLYRSGKARDVSPLVELQEIRHRLHQMAEEAQAAGELALELKIRKELTRTIDQEQRIGQTVKLEVEKSRQEKLMDDVGFQL